MNTPKLPSGAKRTLNLDRLTPTADEEQYSREIVRPTAEMRAAYQKIAGKAFQSSRQLLQAAGINTLTSGLVRQALDAASTYNALSKLNRSMEENRRLIEIALGGGEIVSRATQDLLQSAIVASDLTSPSRSLANAFKPVTEAMRGLVGNALGYPKIALPKISIPAAEPRDYPGWLLSMEPAVTVRGEPQLTRGKVMEAFSELEQTLRLVIHLALANCRPDWWTACVPDKPRREAEKRQARYKNQHPNRPLHPVYFLPPSSYAKIITANREVFEPVFGDVEKAASALHVIFTNMRPFLAHTLPLPDRDFLLRFLLACQAQLRILNDWLRWHRGG